MEQVSMEPMERGRIRIGTSGWSYDHWRGIFYPEGLSAKQYLHHYCGHFSTVECNSTFYHLPRKNALLHWLESTPENFKFALKVNRDITHNKRLRDVSTDVKKFLHLIKPLREKLGPLLFQIPPNLKADPGLLRELLEIHPGVYRYVFESRDPSWWSDEILRLLESGNMAFCIHDYHGQDPPRTVTADFAYFRMHGPDGRYGGSYNEKSLQSLAKQMLDFRSRGLDVYCYFNNDSEGFAPLNARRLMAILGDAAECPPDNTPGGDT